ncbi:cellulose binding domain-containing protein [Kitasatospora sp. NPDC048722]|uniref:cellulose binding domain-containing protein n=1 Tax=Kitasatospora sp. NPDC048722 TaxID=3155639 RepID=UPI0033D68827
MGLAVTRGTASAADTTSACAVHDGLSDWGASFNGDVTIRNTSSTPVDGWQLVFASPGGQAVTTMWNARGTQNGTQVTASNPPDYNATIAAGGTVDFGSAGTSTPGTNGLPATFLPNGSACATY